MHLYISAWKKAILHSNENDVTMKIESNVKVRLPATLFGHVERVD